VPLRAGPDRRIADGSFADRCARQAIEVLVNEGSLNDTEGARGARLLTFVKAYRDADEHAC
jgi:hypothetical protein